MPAIANEQPQVVDGVDELNLQRGVSGDCVALRLMAKIVAEHGIHTELTENTERGLSRSASHGNPLDAFLEQSHVEIDQQAEAIARDS